MTRSSGVDGLALARQAQPTNSRKQVTAAALRRVENNYGGGGDGSGSGDGAGHTPDNATHGGVCVEGEGKKEENQSSPRSKAPQPPAHSTTRNREGVGRETQRQNRPLVRKEPIVCCQRSSMRCSPVAPISRANESLAVL